MAVVGRTVDLQNAADLADGIRSSLRAGGEGSGDVFRLRLGLYLSIVRFFAPLARSHCPTPLSRVVVV
jgi:hypothetical protein